MFLFSSSFRKQIVRITSVSAKPTSLKDAVFASGGPSDSGENQA